MSLGSLSSLRPRDPLAPHRRRAALLVATALGLALLAPTGALAQQEPGEPVPTALDLQVPERQYAGTTAVVAGVLTEEAGAEPVEGAAVLFERRTGGEWAELATVPTDAEGRAEASFQVARRHQDNRVRASYAGEPGTEPGTDPGTDPGTAPSEAGPSTVAIRRRGVQVRVGGPDEVVDEQSVKIWIRVRTGTGTPVQTKVRLQRRDPGGDWRTVRRLRTDAEGRRTLTSTPRVDTRWRVRTAKTSWLRKGRSRVHRIDNLPPGEPVSLPAKAPSPRRSLPTQARAVGEGANGVVRRIPDKVWRSMVGRSWHRGCPVGRQGLRLLRINYWGYDGYRYRGELVANADAIGRMKGALTAMYAQELPIYRMYRVDRFGWSKKLQGADDYASMAADNTSAFNCRQVVGRPGVRSPHAYGRSLDLSPWENPYYAGKWHPNGWWVGRTHPRVAWRSSGHAVVTIMRNHGLRWTYGTRDAHHFDASPGGGKRPAGPVASMAYPELPPVCEVEVCD